MRAITKTSEPNSLIAHRKTPYANYDNLTEEQKDEIRTFLVNEQMGICCFCMDRIIPNRSSMKIAHFDPQATHSSQQLSYKNFLGACKGGEGLPEKQHHCDTRQGKRDIKWNPAEPSHYIEQKIAYESDGSITAPDPTFNDQLTDVLGLNLFYFKNRRKALLLGMMQWWKIEKDRLKGPIPVERLQRELTKRTTEATVPLKPFSPVEVWWLKQKLEKKAR